MTERFLSPRSWQTSSTSAAWSGIMFSNSTCLLLLHMAGLYQQKEWQPIFLQLDVRLDIMAANIQRARQSSSYDWHSLEWTNIWFLACYWRWVDIAFSVSFMKAQEPAITPLYVSLVIKWFRTLDVWCEESGNLGSKGKCPVESICLVWHTVFNLPTVFSGWRSPIILHMVLAWTSVPPTPDLSLTLLQGEGLHENLCSRTFDALILLVCTHLHGHLSADCGIKCRDFHRANCPCKGTEAIPVQTENITPETWVERHLLGKHGTWSNWLDNVIYKIILKIGFVCFWGHSWGCVLCFVSCIMQFI